MTKLVKNDGTWNIYKDIVSESEELEDDIRKLHGMIAAAEKHHEAMFERYRELPGWELLHAQISMALGQPEILVGVMPGEGQE